MCGEDAGLVQPLSPAAMKHQPRRCGVVAAVVALVLLACLQIQYHHLKVRLPSISATPPAGPSYGRFSFHF